MECVFLFPASASTSDALKTNSVSPTSNNAYKDAAPPGTIQVSNKGGAFSVKIKWSSEVKYV